MNLREAAQQALEALKIWDDAGEQPSWYRRKERQEAITALKAALAEPEHEIIQRMRRLKAEAQAEHRRALEQGRCSSCGQELPDELKTEYQVNQDLRNAAMQKLTDVQQEMERSIDSLKAALPKELKLKEQVNPDLPVGCKRCAHPLWCGTKCKSCGKVWDWGDKE